jgi:acyl-CoA reductase-like NAD-dependent aldehyde dehydrogenase
MLQVVQAFDRTLVAELEADDEASLSIFSRDLGSALRAAERLDASAVMVNDHTAFRTDWMPFAGRRQSGYGVGGIPWSMREMAQEKMLVLRYA